MNEMFQNVEGALANFSPDDNNQRLGLFLGSGTLLGQENRLDVGQNSTLGNRHASQELVQLLIIPALI